MNSVTVDDDQLVVVPRGLDKLWSLTRRLTIPMEHVRRATADPSAASKPRGLRATGLRVPGKTSGTFHRDGERTFWNVSNDRDTVVIELVGEKYQRLILTVADPRAVVSAVNRALAG